MPLIYFLSMEILNIYVKPTFDILGKTISIYGIFYIIGVFASLFVLFCLKKYIDYKSYDIIYCIIFAFVGGMIGSKVLFIITSLKTIINLHISIQALMMGGFVFYGGLIGGYLGGFIYCKAYKLSFLLMSDVVSITIPLGHAFGRLGCLCGGCCYGFPHNGKFSVTYIETLGDAPLNTPLFPVQLIESIILLLLFATLLITYKKFHHIKGFSTASYLLSYSTIRFVLEFFRGDKIRGLLWGLSTSQWISILIIIITISLTICHKKSKIQELK